MANPNPSPATRFKKGVSGNPAGFPKGGVKFAWEIKRQLREAAADGDRSKVAAIVSRTIEDAIDINRTRPSAIVVGARKLLVEQVDGKPAQAVDMTVDGRLTLVDIVGRYGDVDELEDGDMELEEGEYWEIEEVD